MMRYTHVNLTDWQSAAGFSQALVAPAGGRHIFLAGVGSEAADRTALAPGDVAEQCRLAWASIREVLAAAGATARDIVRVRTYVTDVRALGAVTAARRAALGPGPYPPHTFLVVAALADPNMLVEIEVDAMVYDDDGAA